MKRLASWSALASYHNRDDLVDGRYRLVDKLGYGGYSTIWLARDLNFRTWEMISPASCVLICDPIKNDLIRWSRTKAMYDRRSVSIFLADCSSSGFLFPPHLGSRYPHLWNYLRLLWTSSSRSSRLRYIGKLSIVVAQDYDTEFVWSRNGLTSTTCWRIDHSLPVSSRARNSGCVRVNCLISFCSWRASILWYILGSIGCQLRSRLASLVILLSNFGGAAACRDSIESAAGSSYQHELSEVRWYHLVSYL